MVGAEVMSLDIVCDIRCVIIGITVTVIIYQNSILWENYHQQEIILKRRIAKHQQLSPTIK